MAFIEMSNVTEALQRKLVELYERKELLNWIINYENKHTIFTIIDFTTKASSYSADCWDKRHIYELEYYAKDGVRYLFYVVVMFDFGEKQRFLEFQKTIADIIENTEYENVNQN